MQYSGRQAILSRTTLRSALQQIELQPSALRIVDSTQRRRRRGFGRQRSRSGASCLVRFFEQVFSWLRSTASRGSILYMLETMACHVLFRGGLAEAIYWNLLIRILGVG